MGGGERGGLGGEEDEVDAERDRATTAYETRTAVLPVRLLAATNKPTNMPKCTAVFLYRHSILPWCQYILVPTASHVHINLRILLLLSAFSWPGASDSAHYFCHPIPLLLQSPYPMYRSCIMRTPVTQSPGPIHVH